MAVTVYLCVRVCMCVYLCVYLCVCMDVYVYVFGCVGVCEWCHHLKHLYVYLSYCMRSPNKRT